MSALDAAVKAYASVLDEYGYSEKSANEAAQELLDLRARLAEAEELLKRLEWAGNIDGWTVCPVCASPEEYPHSEICELAVFLKRMGAE